MNGQTMQIEGAPSFELTRSPAAAVIGRLAEESNLLMSHFEHRVELPLPEMWLPAGRPELGQSPEWQNGVLPESKYQAFRHDRITGSFHPGHRAKWTAHELCHGLVGFAWQPGASRFFHALAARLSEVLPVALWYFFDEAGLRRCSKHHGQGPLFRTFCAECEDAAAESPLTDDPQYEHWMSQGRAFVMRELDAVKQSIKNGRMVSHRVASLDLAGDSLAYASAHGERLNSRAFQSYVELFCNEDHGFHTGLESLISRIEELTLAIMNAADASPLKASRWDWVAQDLGWRLFQIWSETEGEAADALHQLIEELAGRCNQAGIQDAINGYESLCNEWHLPEPDDLFAVGYALANGYGRSQRQVTAGIQSALPSTLELLEDSDASVAEFLANDAPLRVPLGRRFAAFLALNHSRVVADVARYEAAIIYPRAADVDSLALVPDALDAGPGTQWVRGLGGELLHLSFDVPAHLELLLKERVIDPSLQSDAFLAIVNLPDGELALLTLSDTAAQRLAAKTGSAFELDGLSEQETQLLIEHGLVIKERYL
jgi:hypothetical protein